MATSAATADFIVCLNKMVFSILPPYRNLIAHKTYTKADKSLKIEPPGTI